MEIISLPFVFLAIVSLIIYYCLNHKYRISFLALISCGFIATFSWSLLLYVLVFTLVNFLLGRLIAESRYRISIFRAGIFINLSQLVLLKYSSFAIDPFFHLMNSDIQVSTISEFLVPVGISYFTLQGLGYLINVYMRWEKPEIGYLNFALYIVFFPKFISGPVERSNNFLPQLNTVRSFNNADVVGGLRLVLRGFFKKVIIAGHLASTVNQAYSNTDSIGGINVLMVILIQPLYLYFDFSGYTDIAIGFARVFGINLMQNFNRPFLAENVTTFWRKFHISLSSWFNDYVFKQSSFRMRKLKSYATVFAMLITWILFGIWHGAGWNFMLLGLLQALAIYLEFITKQKRKVLFSYFPQKLRVWAGRIFTYCFFAISLTIFFAPDIQTTFRVFARFHDFGTFTKEGLLLLPLLLGLFFALTFIIAEILQNDYEIYFNKLQKRWNASRSLRLAVYFTACIIILSQLSGNTSFIYEMF